MGGGGGGRGDASRLEKREKGHFRDQNEVRKNQ